MWCASTVALVGVKAQGQADRTFARASSRLLMVPSWCNLILSSMQSGPSVVFPAGITVRVPASVLPARFTPLLDVDAGESCTFTAKALYDRWTTPWLRQYKTKGVGAK